MNEPLRLVTGAFGFTGRHLTELLLARGLRVRTLTEHGDRPNPWGERVEVRPFAWDDPAALVESLRGVEVLYNTYWIRFPHGKLTFPQAVENSLLLWEAAREAGVRRVVHVSIANPSLDSPLPYYSGKARVEQGLIESGLEYAIVRPTVIFGDHGILLNNIAWMLRHLPLFATPGDGEYRMQPIYVGDLVEMMATAGETGAPPSCRTQ
ncbi:MAG TPA: NAD-dependent epimerase/dehydratase family protein [Armatimonadota bacterium]|jgi:NADH dehydrogenase